MYSIIIICGAGAIMYNDTVKKIYTERARTIWVVGDRWRAGGRVQQEGRIACAVTKGRKVRRG